MELLLFRPSPSLIENEPMLTFIWISAVPLPLTFNMFKKKIIQSSQAQVYQQALFHTNNRHQRGQSYQMCEIHKFY